MRRCLRAALVASLLGVALPARALQELGRVEFAGGARDVEVAGGLAYVVGFRLHVFDVSDPTAPAEVGGAPLRTFGADVEVAGGLAYVVGRNGFEVIDVSVPRSPVARGFLATGVSQGVEVSGDRAYVVASGVLRILDVSDPTAPAELGSFAAGFEGVRDVAVSGDLVYLAIASGFGLRVVIVDASDPARPVELGRSELIGSGSVYRDIEVAGGHAFVVGWPSAMGVADFHVIDVSDPAHPFLAGELAVGASAMDVEIEGDVAYVAVDSATLGIGLRAVDLSSPAHPVLLGTLGPPGPRAVTALALSAGRAYVAVDDPRVGSESGTLQIVDVSHREHPAILGQLGICCGTASRIVVEAGLAHVTRSLPAELLLFDVSDPAAPTPAGSVRFGGVETGVLALAADAAGALVYVAVGTGSTGGPSSLRIIDVSQPAAPVEVGRLELGPGLAPADLKVVGNLAYILQEGALRIADVSDPSAPREVGSAPVFAPRSLDVEDEVAYVTFAFGDLAIFDVSHPAQPRVLSRVEIRDAAGVDAARGVVWVADPGGWVRAYDVHDPAAPVALGAVRNARTWDVQAVGDKVYAGSGDHPGEGGIRVFDASDPGHPVALGGVSPRFDFDVVGGVVYAANNNDLAILDFGPEFAANRPPVADAGPDQTLECASHAGALATLDGSGSSDPDGDPLAFLWTNSFGSTTGPGPSVSLAPGAHQVALEVDDGRGGTASDEVSILVEDRIAPEVDAALVWVRGPGDRGTRGLRLRAEYRCVDACDPDPIAAAEIDGAPVRDGEVVALRGPGSPFEKRLRVVCTDASGNRATAEASPRTHPQAHRDRRGRD